MVVLGYALTVATQVALCAVLGLAIRRADAVWLGTMLALPVFPATILYTVTLPGSQAWRRVGGAVLVLAVLRVILR